MEPTKVEPRAVADAFAALGVQPGDKVAMHSRTSSLGRVLVNLAKQGREAMRQGVHDFIDGVLQAVGPDGLLMVPTFSYCFAGRPDTPPWHPEKSPSQTGRLTEELRRRPDAVRSNHPTHSVACIGKGAAAICADHERRTPLGLDSPFHRLAAQGGLMCYLGTDGATLSLLHVAEVVAAVPYAKVFNWGHVGWESRARVEREDGSVAEVDIEEAPGCSRNFVRFDEEAQKEGLFRAGLVYESQTRVFSARDALDLAVDRIRHEPGFFLCKQGACPACDVRWKVI